MSTESIGSFLKRQRELKGMSVAEVSRITRVPVISLEAIESDHFDDLPGEVFVRGFLKSYAHSLGLVPSEIVARYTSQPSRRVRDARSRYKRRSSPPERTGPEGASASPSPSSSSTMILFTLALTRSSSSRAATTCHSS